MKRWYALLPLGVLVATLAACAGPNPVGPRMDLSVGPVVYRTEVVKDDADRQRGLMFRETLADDEAMLFVFEADDNLSFWMKNTLIDLSIAWIDSRGTIREIADMRAGDLSSVVSSHAVRYALEVPQGSFGRRGVRVGDRIDLDAVRAFLAR